MISRAWRIKAAGIWVPGAPLDVTQIASEAWDRVYQRIFRAGGNYLRIRVTPRYIASYSENVGETLGVISTSCFSYESAGQRPTDELVFSNCGIGVPIERDTALGMMGRALDTPPWVAQKVRAISAWSVRPHKSTGSGWTPDKRWLRDSTLSSAQSDCAEDGIKAGEIRTDDRGIRSFVAYATPDEIWDAVNMKAGWPRAKGE